MTQQNNPTQSGIPNFSVPFINVDTGGISTPWWTFFVNIWNRTGSGPGNLVFASGMEISWPGPIVDSLGNSTIPTGWLLEDGTAYIRTGKYANLFIAIGTTWGIGDGVTTFNIPDRVNKMLIGAGNTYTLGTDYNVGTSASTIKAGTTYWIIKI